MQKTDQLIDELSRKLLESQRKLIELRQLADAANEPESVDTVDDLLALGLQMGMYVTMLSSPEFDDMNGVSEVHEYCVLVDQIYTKTNTD